MSVPPVPNEDAPGGITDVPPVPGKNEPAPDPVPPDSKPPVPPEDITDV